jgi:hypothetical protein
MRLIEAKEIQVRFFVTDALWCRSGVVGRVVVTDEFGPNVAWVEMTNAGLEALTDIRGAELAEAYELAFEGVREE